MSTGVLVPPDADETVEFARRAERLGYDCLWHTELWGTDAFLALASAADVTDTIDLGTAIVNVFSRSPATLAQAAATLADQADGRVRLGLGTSTKKTIEDLHGTSFDSPARQLHETAALVGRFLGAEGRVKYDGQLFDVADFPALDADVPVYTAALGPATRRATGRTADGWIPHNIPFDELGTAFETVAEAAREAGRDPDAITVAPYVPAAVSEDPEDARGAARGHIAYYVGSGEGYRRAVGEVYPERATEIAESWGAGDRKAARAAVTDEMVRDLAVAGTPETARERFDAVAGLEVIDEPIVVVPAGVDDEIADLTVEALSPDAR